MPVTVNSAIEIKNLPVNSAAIKDTDKTIVDVLVSGDYTTSINTMQELADYMKTKITKSDVGLGNVVNLDTSTTANITDSSNKRFVTNANLSVINNTSGINTGDETQASIISKISYTPANDTLVLKKDTLNDVDNTTVFGIRTNTTGGLFFNNGIVGFANTVSQFTANQNRFFYNINTGETAFGSDGGQRLSVDNSSITLFDSSNNSIDVGVFSGNIKSLGGIPIYALSGGNIDIKTINGNSILGTGDITISSGAVSSVFGRTGAVVSAVGDYNGGQITTTPTALITGTNIQSNLSSIDGLLSGRPTGVVGFTSGVSFYTSSNNITSVSDFTWNNSTKTLKMVNGLNDLSITGFGLTKNAGDGPLTFTSANGYTLNKAPLSGNISILSGNAVMQISETAATSGTPTILSIVGAAHTGLNNLGSSDISFNLGRTVQFNTGNRPEQVAILIQNPTYAAVGASTYTDAATLVINGAPNSGANVTLTNSSALWIKSGNTKISGTLNKNNIEGDLGVISNTSFIATTSAFVLANSTALQKCFNSPANGAFNADALSTYFFEISLKITGLSAASSSVSFGFLGTATFVSLDWSASSNKTTTITVPAASITMSTSVATSSVVTQTNTGTAAYIKISGILRTNAGGTIIPAVATSVGVATASVSINSYCFFNKIGSSIVTNTPNMS